MLIMTMRRLQTNLKFLGFYNGHIDGIKKSQTIKAIKDYQRARGLAVTGYARQDTIDVLRAEIMKIQEELNVEKDGVAGIKTQEARENQEVLNWDNIKHFKKQEFTCKCGCGSNNMDLRVVAIADKIREHFNTPVIVTSGTRCEKHNKEVGGVRNSRHRLGKAIDLYARGINGKDLIAYTKSLVASGELRYSYRIGRGDCVHIDIL